MSVDRLVRLDNRASSVLIRQSEASECGLACLAMICCSHGLQIDLPVLRRRFDSSLRGSTLQTLIKIATLLGLSSRALRVEVSELPAIRTPAIVHWNLNHFVVLDSVTKTPRGMKFKIRDPAAGVRTVTEGAFSDQFTGVVLELGRSTQFRPQRAKAPLRVGQLWSNISGLKASIATILFLSIVLQLATLAMPFYLQVGIDSVLPAGDNKLLRALALGFGAVALINVLASWLRQVTLLNLTNLFSFQVIDNLFRQLLNLPVSWFSKRHVGDVISRFGSIQPIIDFVSQGMITTVVDGGMAFITLTLMYIYSPTLASIALLTWVLYILLKYGSFAALRLANVSSISANARENSAFIETVRGINTIKAFGRESPRQEIWQNLKASAVNAQLKLGKISAHFEALSGVVLALERVLFVFIALTFALNGKLTVGMIFAFQAYKEQFLGAATRLVDLGLRYRLIDVHLGRVADIALSPTEEQDSFVAETSPDKVRGRIELRNVYFRYGASDPFILKDVNLKIDSGDFVALVGPSGSGKTTLLNIVMGLLEPTSGSVLVDGIPIRQFGNRRWRSNIGSMMQEDRLFAGSLAENIAFFDQNIDMERVRLVCAQAGILGDIEKMPLGFETLVGDMGSTLSGGQKQRLMFARAVYSNPACLIMDEGTANLDSESENQIVNELKKLMITRIVAAHRSLVISSAKHVLLVRDGAVTHVNPEFRRRPSSEIPNHENAFDMNRK